MKKFLLAIVLIFGSKALAYRANPVSIGLSNVHLEYAHVDISGNVSLESVDWINGNCSKAGGTGKNLCSFNSNVWSSAPFCWCVVINSSTSSFCNVYSTATTSSVGFWTSTGPSTDLPFDAFCIGVK